MLLAKSTLIWGNRGDLEGLPITVETPLLKIRINKYKTALLLQACTVTWLGFSLLAALTLYRS